MGGGRVGVSFFLGGGISKKILNKCFVFGGGGGREG